MTGGLQLALCLFLLPFLVSKGSAIRCYQCASSQEAKGQDSCGAYDKFEREKHVPVDCEGEDANTPGTFCMKMVQQGPVGFIWDGRWRQVIRRCASVAKHGNTEVCNWGVYPNGVYWEECYCSQDGCNSSNAFVANFTSIGVFVAISIFLVPLISA